MFWVCVSCGAFWWGLVTCSTVVRCFGVSWCGALCVCSCGVGLWVRGCVCGGLWCSLCACVVLVCLSVGVGVSVWLSVSLWVCGGVVWCVVWSVLGVGCAS